MKLKQKYLIPILLLNIVLVNHNIYIASASNTTCTTDTQCNTNLNTRIDPSDNCKIRFFCDNQKKCCGYG